MRGMTRFVSQDMKVCILLWYIHTSFTMDDTVHAVTHMYYHSTMRKTAWLLQINTNTSASQW